MFSVNTLSDIDHGQSRRFIIKKKRTTRYSSTVVNLSCDLFLWDVKEPTSLFEKSRVRRPRWCSQPLLGFGGLSVRTHLNWSLALLCVPHHMVEVINLSMLAWPEANLHKIL